MGDKLSVFIDVSVKILKISIPVIFITVITYLFYMRLTVIRTEKTYDDIVMVVENIKNYVKDGGKLKNFNSDFIAYSGYISSDLRMEQTERGNIIYNRYGGLLIFNEAFLNSSERNNYMQMAKDPRLLKNQYKGLNAYTILFTELRRRECRELSQVNWRLKLKNFMGMEVSYITEKNPYNGINKLNRGLLTDNSGREEDVGEYVNLFGGDEGLLSRRTLSKWEAVGACRCLTDNCTFALKFKAY